MNEARAFAGCSVFRGNIVVSGGTNQVSGELNTVESYNVFADSWSPMPSMINSKIDHSLVVVKNKLFVIAKEINSCEYFDNDCKKFFVLKSPFIFDSSEVISAGNIISIVHSHNEFGLSISCYDVDKDEWFNKSCDVTTHLKGFAAVKVPLY